MPDMSQIEKLPRKLLPLPQNVPVVHHRKKTELKKMIRDTVKLRFVGASFEEISEALKVSSRQARRYYEKFIEENKKDWLEHKGSVLTELNVDFKDALNFAKKKRLGASDEIQAGAYNRQVVDIMRNYIGFLKDCGYVTPATVDGFAITADAKKTDVIGELIDTYQDFLKGVIEGEAKPASDTKTVAP